MLVKTLQFTKYKRCSKSNFLDKTYKENSKKCSN